MYNAWELCPIFTDHRFSLQILIKVSNIRFHENPSTDSQVFRADGQMDRQKWQVNSRFSQLCERAQKRVFQGKNIYIYI
jgi:hypothetical protein